MVSERLPAQPAPDFKLLGDKLQFRSGKSAPNRFLKAALTERLWTWDSDVSKRGIPTQALINVYERWGNGGFGMILTGNVVADPMSFDGVELHGAHGYMISQFITPATNLRTDKYGGNPENRIRLALEIYEAIRKEIPAETQFLVGIKINSVEFHDMGFGNEDLKAISKAIENAGFDFVELTGGSYEKFQFHHERESIRKREAFFLEFADAVRPIFKKTVVYVTGGFRTAHGMVEAVRSGSTDGIGLGRPITAEPDLPKKLLSGQVLSAVKDQFAPNDLAMHLSACNTQMVAMGRKSLKELHGNILGGIPDFSIEKVANEYLNAVDQYTEEIKIIAEANLPIVDNLHFPETLHQISWE